MRRFILFMVAVICAAHHIHAEAIVGKLNGSLNVSATGAATYTIPIDLLSSPYGSPPEVSLFYNSQAGNGLAGYGWNLSGLSSITIGPRTTYFDGTAEGLYEGEDNAYYLDGMRLLLVSGQNGQVGAEYRTESERYSIIRIDSALAETPSTFTVKTTDGTTLRYGSRTGRGYYSQTACYEWALDYVEDRLGNYMIYEYALNGLTLMPMAIQYGKNKNTNGGSTYKMEFFYETRSDKIPVHRFERQEMFPYRLIQISCERGNQIYRRYNLTYESGTHVFSHLASVKEYGMQSTSYPETTFTWEDLPGYDLEASSTNVSNIAGQNFSDMYFFAADVENSGYTNLVGLFNYTAGNSPYLAANVWTKNNTNGNFTDTPSDFYTTQAGISLGDIYTAYRQGGTVAHLGNSQPNSIVLPYTTDFGGSNRIVFDCIKEGLLIPYLMQSSGDEVNYIITDIDRDGHDEIVIVEKVKENGTYPASLIRLNLTENSLSRNDFSMNLAGVPSLIKAADINLDGMADLLVCTSNGFYIYWNNAGEFSDSNRYHGTNFNNCSVLEMGDVNGDGLADLIINKKNSSNWLCAVNQGTVTEPFNFYNIAFLDSIGANNNNKNEAYCIVQDLDNDGMSDLLVGMSFYNGNNFLSAQFVILKSQGALFTYLDSSHFPTKATFPSLGKIVQGDFDGDGVTEIVYYGGAFHSASTDVAWRVLKPDGFSPSTNRITSVTDGLGTKQKIEYALLTNDDVYQRTSASVFPLLTMRAALPVVKRTETIAGTDTLWTNFKYKDAIFHWQGKGLLGFKNRTTSSHTGLKSVEQFAVNNNYYVLHKTSERTYTSNGTLWKTDSIHTTFTPIAPKSFFEHINYVRSEDDENGYIDISSYGYDAYGNLDYKEANDELFNTETEATFWESTAPGKYIKNLPLVAETVKSVGTLNEEEEERIVYTRDNLTGQPLSCKTYRNNNLLQTDLYTYNPCGQVLTHTVVNGASTDSLTTTYNYNTSGLLTRVTDPMGLATVYTYNSNGLLYTEKDHINLSTFHLYDDMLREKKVYNVISSLESTIGTGDYANSVYKVTETRKGEPTQITYYDGLERKVAEAQQRFDGRWLYTDYKYLPTGQLGFVSFPHTTASVSSTGTFNTYDAYGRMTSQTDSNNKTSTWSYAPYEVTSTIDGITKTTYYANRDVISSIEDNSGYADFDTDAAARVRSVYHNGKETTVDYDDFGRITQTTDMIGVTRNYTYDANGNPLSVTQGTSSRTTQYDKYGRLLSQTFHDAGMTDVQTTYTYNAKNQLVSDSSRNHVYTYEYDNYGRLKKENRRIVGNDTESISLTYTYNTNGQLGTKKAVLGTTGVTLTEKYTFANGWRTAITVNDSLVWHLDEEDDKGMTLSTSNLMDTLAWNYDVYGHLLAQNVTGEHTLQQSYAYNLATGNVTTWNGGTCTYDEFNRLTQWGTFLTSYDDEGNILSKTPIGEMRYDGFQLESARVNNQLAISQYQCDLEYLRSIERPRSIQENNKRVEFEYDGDRQRVWMNMLYVNSHTPDTLGIRYYVSDNYEINQKNGTFKIHYYYVGGTPYDAPAVVLVENAVPTIYQIYRDNIGSIVMYASRNETQRLKYNPWGMRLYQTVGNLPIPPTYVNENTRFIRTYTGHEEIPFFGLLNANARLYNPYLGRFMSPDPLLAMSGDPLEFNPYVYARNNPLSYVDQDGEFPWLIIAAAIMGGAMNVVDNWGNIKNFGDALVYFGVGAAAGAAGALISPFGAGFIGGFLNGMVSGTASGLILGGGNAAIAGGNVGKGALNGAWQGALYGGVIGGLGGGLDAWANGKNFWTGASKNTMPYLEANQAFLTTEGNAMQIRPERYIEESDPYYQQLLKEARERYPNKAGRTELHHIEPKYIGGDPNGPLIELDAAYHQMITNEFRENWHYGWGKIDNINLREHIIRQVYSKYPLPVNSLKVSPINPVPFALPPAEPALFINGFKTLPVDVPFFPQINARIINYNR